MSGFKFPLAGLNLATVLVSFYCIAINVSLAAEEETVEVITVRSNLLVDGLILFGCVFILAASIGMLRFPDFYTRLHASSKLVTLGGIGIFAGAGIAFSPLDIATRLLLTALFFFLTAPLSGYMIGRAGYLRGLEPYREEGSVDEWNACGSAAELDTLIAAAQEA